MLVTAITAVGSFVMGGCCVLFSAVICDTYLNKPFRAWGFYFRCMRCDAGREWPKDHSLKSAYLCEACGAMDSDKSRRLMFWIGRDTGKRSDTRQVIFEWLDYELMPENRRPERSDLERLASALEIKPFTSPEV